MRPERGTVTVTQVETEEAGAEKALRGKGRGSRFAVLGREVHLRLWEAPTSNRLNFVLAFLVLLAGTGADQRLSKWSSKACDEHVGLGKPRAKAAIEELVAAGLVERTDAATKMSPQYQLPDVSLDENPIFLPVQLVTGLRAEASVLRRVRETGDPLVLRLLLDLYGSIQLDATFGAPLSFLRQGRDSEVPARKLSEVGVHALWTMALDGGHTASRALGEPHITKKSWDDLWERLRILQKIGALTYEPWVFDGAADDAEPLFPVDFSVAYTNRADDEVAQLSRLCQQAAYSLTEEREYVLERAADFTIVLPVHHRPPALRGVAKLIVEADTPGCRRSYAMRMQKIAHYRAAYEKLIDDAANGRVDRPLGSIT